MGQRKTLPARLVFKQAYRAARLQHRFLIEIDAVIDRYREIEPSAVPWNKIYNAVEGLYLQAVPADIRKAVLHAVRG
jgi:hypothetical protein